MRNRHSAALSDLRLAFAVALLSWLPLSAQVKTVPGYPNIAVLEDDGTFVGTSHLFSLDNATLKFSPSVGGYTLRRSSLQWDNQLGSTITYDGQASYKVVAPGSKEITLPFSFPFAGRSWQSVVVNSTGNLSFGWREDRRPVERFFSYRSRGNGLQRDGPGICALWRIFTWLDPSRTYVLPQPDRVTITWDVSEPYNHPLWFSMQPNRSRFRVVLYSSGDIDISFNGVDVKDGITGLFSGSGPVQQSMQLSSLLNGTNLGPTSFEVFAYPALFKDATDMMKAFYGAYDDVYDFGVFFTDFRFDVSEAEASSLGPPQDQTTGIGTSGKGRPSSLFGSAGRFQSGMMPSWIGGTAYGRIGTNKNGTFNGLLTDYDPARYLISHELGHRWLAFLEYMDGAQRKPLSDPIHWFDSLHVPAANPIRQTYESSPMNGSYWVEKADGSFEEHASGDHIPTGYGFLDLYAMGLLRADQVPDFFNVENLVPIPSNGLYTVRGTKKIISISQVVAAMGSRAPSADIAQKQFATCFILLVQKGAVPTQAGLERIDGVRRAWEDHFGKATGGRGSMTTVLKTKTVPVSQPTITSITPVPVTTSASSQTIIISGGQFQSGLVASVTSPGGTVNSINPLSVSSSSFAAALLLNVHGAWTIKIKNPDGGESNTFTFTVAAAVAIPTIVSVVNGASGQPITSLAANTWVTIFGSNLALSTATASGPFPDTLGGARVLLRIADGQISAPIYYVSPTQINFLVPDLGTVNSTTVAVKLVTLDPPSLEQTFTVTKSLPAAFLGADTALITDDQGRVLAAGEALHDGDVYVAYFNGLGSVTPAVPVNQIVPAALFALTPPILLSLGGGQADVLFAGLTPGLIGVYQVNFRHHLSPSGTPRGDVGRLTLSDGSSAEFLITVQ
jgi:uncharacterized protein (TIGR03437 family)